MAKAQTQTTKKETTKKETTKKVKKPAQDNHVDESVKTPAHHVDGSKL